MEDAAAVKESQTVDKLPEGEGGLTLQEPRFRPRTGDKHRVEIALSHELEY
eukprot:CAMPEP_0180507174 /NCGR_PEP_ID=MMETSP1036_2-20121128/48429_1 /TAXON_ID=632150 /ORGANISM="Azadinium spinosum, Strain 3D9" /LENGTH=50 /DNA_ID=CAMNT_0022517259 /DNA_START=316 /DNA_END=468 /DNA_ORIENTATION=+